MKDRTQSKTFYGGVASRHRLFYTDWPAVVRAEGAWLDAILRPRGVRTVLDCTCGIGTQALGLALNGYEVTASDLSEANLAEAQRGAEEFGVWVLWQPADVCRLYQAPISGPFDAVISLGNSLPHLLTERDLSAALRQMFDMVEPGGPVIVGQRDWDAVLVERPRCHFRHEHLDTPAAGQRTILFDLWRYDDPLVDFEVFFMQEGLDGWDVDVFPLRYRMWRRRELLETMEEAGFVDVHQVEHPWEVRLAGRKPG